MKKIKSTSTLFVLVGLLIAPTICLSAQSVGEDYKSKLIAEYDRLIKKAEAEKALSESYLKMDEDKIEVSKHYIKMAEAKIELYKARLEKKLKQLESSNNSQ